MKNHSHHNQHPTVGRVPDRPARASSRAGARQTEEPSDDTAGGFLAILRGYPITLAVTVLSGAVFITAAAFAAYHSPAPTTLVAPLSAIAMALAALAGGMTVGKLNPTCPMGAGLLCGVLTAALLTILSLLLGENAGGLVPWLMRIGVIPLHLLGGIFTRPRSHAPTHTATGRSSRR